MSENPLTITNSSCKKLRNGDDIDMLSDLPDSILCQIISELETKEAVQTSLLSSRYKSLWKNITSLSFDYRCFGPRVLWFAHLVNWVLLSLKSKSINNLSLKLGPPLEIYDVSFWISAAIGINVKVLKLHIEGAYVDNGMSMPACLYTSKTLEVLELCVWISNTLILDVPEFVSLPKLTKLKLQRVNYSSDDSVRRLISGCSSLEDLRITREVCDNVGTFTIDCPTLKILNYMFLSIQGFIDHNFEFELNAPALVELQIMDNTSREFSVVNLCSLENANIYVSSPETVDVDSHCERVVQLIQGFYDVSHLWISGHALESLSHASSLEKISRHALLIMDTKDSEQILLDDLLDGSNNIYLSRDSSDTTHMCNGSSLKSYLFVVCRTLKQFQLVDSEAEKANLL